MADVLYLCNGKNPKCYNSTFCQIDCFHTNFPEFAKNGPCKDPENDPVRFEKNEFAVGKIFYVEREDTKSYSDWIQAMEICNLKGE